ncbi:bifunctional diaminohydroxyphosphoribosylaminopyrimidine deaminase/5-amino-6-(5-phosphoribosylamino)uracil reductase RibD [Aestuariibaculum sp. M13]|uniref:bifunctional diaminohydroxyphosphoribosylaminopyrimidine deaminase/5-amino-6-(5-phosphoribosylamino)uracil reductase RibD n=1 Tax=Aestuariibaculum sp. M13 TaxID=2967132 RepID=UPI002159C855|nr:bifunctional diaminohydroxyphosphoribosylaminopyrimidine deaminase/5-amino-6-(5-phosphoribosylamino)uracil reductase RibD [Aestuariibaculum sp. M13]MCR8669097.1 bifunctional diaminohydroxyphosphoribosylaminopyrimidine deaminase/5-amino-6-(5-phosphoribosylamino)uracil reductase RibD [Aestuariibaculum sp. M13]
MKTHEYYIRRCIEIAKNGLGYTRPNPMVGSVIVYNNKIIGEGFTSAYGGNHAEVNAINSVKDKNLLKEATIYVTLEPCSHYGKTPPCSDLIIKHEIPKIVIGCLDDNILVAGKGIEKLRNAGRHVTVGILEQECKEHHKRFFTFHNKKRPYIILKWAETADGFIAPQTKDEQKPVWITNTFSRQLVHKWRAEEQAILVGTNTVLQDNPSLTTRDWTGQHPIRVVLDAEAKLPKNLSVFRNEAKTITITKENIDFSENIAQQITELLYKENITSIIIEGGAKTLQTFIDENLWDEARIFTGSTTFKAGTKTPKFSGKLISEEHIINDTLKTYTND